MSSPRAWGCFSCKDFQIGRHSVFPTCVGVFLGIERAMDARLRLPHVRGGVSNSIYAWQRFVVSSPRAWGCFHFHQRDKRRGRVFPTCVGVFPSLDGTEYTVAGLPHVRGGVSKGIKNDYYQKSSSLPCVGVFPHKRGSAGPLKRRKPCL